MNCKVTHYSRSRIYRSKELIGFSVIKKIATCENSAMKSHLFIQKWKTKQVNAINNLLLRWSMRLSHYKSNFRIRLILNCSFFSFSASSSVIVVFTIFSIFVNMSAGRTRARIESKIEYIFGSGTELDSILNFS